MKWLLPILLLVGLAGAQTHTFPATDTDNVFTGSNTFNTVDFQWSSRLVSTLGSAAASPSRTYRVTDALNTNDCTVGGGVSNAICTSNGTTWNPIGGTGAISSVFGRTGAVVAVSGDYTWDKIGAGSNLFPQTMGTAGSLSPLNIGQVAGSQVWIPSSIQAPALAFSTTGGNIASNHNIHVVVTYNSSLGESLPSLDAFVQTSACVSSQCSVTVTAPSLPSGYTSYTVYSCDSISAASCSWLKQTASPNCVAITGNCVIATVGAGAGVPTTGTAFIQPPNVQAGFVPQGAVPFLFGPKADGNNYPLAGMDLSNGNPPLPTPNGTFMFFDRTFVNDSGQNISQGPCIKNTLFSVCHRSGNVTTGTSSTIQDQAMAFTTFDHATGSPAYEQLGGIYGETHITNVNSICSPVGGFGGEDCAFGIRARTNIDVAAASLNSGSGVVGLHGSASSTVTGGGLNAFFTGVFGSATQETNNNQSWVAFYAGVAGYANAAPGNTNATGGASFEAVPPLTKFSTSGAIGNSALHVGANANWDFVINSFATQKSKFQGTLELGAATALKTNAIATMGVTGSLGVTGAITVNQLATLSGGNVTNVGATGSSTYSYVICAVDGNGKSTCGPTLTTTTGNATLNSSNFNRTPNLTYAQMDAPGVSVINVYRTVCSNGGLNICSGGGATGIIGTLTQADLDSQGSGNQFFSDQGASGDGTTPPANNNTGGVQAFNYLTTTNCAAVGSAASPSVASCTSASAGSFSCATNAVNTCTVNTTAVTANSEIFVTQRLDTTTGTRLGVTCNATANATPPNVSAVVAGTSFSIPLTQPVTNPQCYSYHIVN